jgi:hypothetical protein
VLLHTMKSWRKSDRLPEQWTARIALCMRFFVRAISFSPAVVTPFPHTMTSFQHQYLLSYSSFDPSDCEGFALQQRFILQGVIRVCR